MSSLSNVYDVLVTENGPPLRWFCEECDDSWKKSSNVKTRGHGKVDEAQLINKITEHDDSPQKVGRQSGRHDESYWITTVRCSKDGAIKIQTEEVREEEEEMRKRKENVIVH